ncbi:MAG: hypothetical protein HWN65_02140 [Candidatus Helarchaeota archaeon]|nr:hypothetical protein [Candidatus Helarchaeota archaeon]
MTKSSRRKDKIAGRPLWEATDERCEECKGEMLKTGRFSYCCTACGLTQERYPTRIYRKRGSRRR